MGAKQSAETRRALELIDSGLSVYEAAEISKIYPSTIYRALKIQKEKNKKKRVAKNIA